MLGVLPAYRDAGVGRSLKLQQREEALARGIELIEWTFDPLELKNAFFNIERLGAIVRRYCENQYGITTSPLHGGLPTDRCLAEWWLASPRARSDSGGRRAYARRPWSGIDVPADIARSAAQIRAAPAKSNSRWDAAPDGRLSNAGLAVTGFERGGHEGTYLLGAVEMRIERVTLRQIRMPLVHFFETSFGRTTERHIILVEVPVKAFPDGAKSPPAKILSTTRSGPVPRG